MLILGLLSACIWCLGRPMNGGEVVDPITSDRGPFDQIAVGGGSACGVRTDGSVACWGSHDIVVPHGVVKIGVSSTSGGTPRVCGLDGDGNIVCGDDPAPILVGPFVDLAVTSSVGCGLADNGSVACDDQETQAAFADGGTWTRLAAGAGFCAWNADETRCTDIPASELSGRTDVTEIAMTGQAVCELFEDGSSSCGLDDIVDLALVNMSFPVGLSSDGTFSDYWSPGGNDDFPDTYSDVSAGDGVACALTADGEAVCARIYVSPTLGACD